MEQVALELGLQASVRDGAEMNNHRRSGSHWSKSDEPLVAEGGWRSWTNNWERRQEILYQVRTPCSLRGLIFAQEAMGTSKRFRAEE